MDEIGIDALFRRAVALRKLGRSEEELAVYDEVVAWFGNPAEPELKEQAATALVNKGVVLGQLKRSAEALAVFNDMLARFGSAEEPAIKDLVAEATSLKEA